MCRLGEMVIAYLLDLILGEPRGIPHPVVGIGRFISFLENILYPKTTIGLLVEKCCEEDY